jgi:hypothetical protein
MNRFFSPGRRPLAGLLLLAMAAATPANAQKPAGEKKGAPSAPTTSSSPSAAPGAKPPLNESLKGEALAEYDAAVLLFSDGDFAGASLKFQRAYTLSKDARLLWNAGAAEKQQRHYATMYILVSRYLREEGPMLAPSDAAAAKQLLETVESFISHLTVKAEPAGAEFFIDDVRVGTIPTSEPLIAEMGTRRFRLHKAGYKDWSAAREVVGGTPLVLEATLEKDIREGTLRISAGPGDSIKVDGKPVGKQQWQGPLSAGVHALSVSAPDKKPYQTDVAIEAGQPTTLRVSLEPLGQDKGSGFVSWPWVVGGLAVVTALGVGAYFAFAPDDPPPPSSAEGTVPPGVLLLNY